MENIKQMVLMKKLIYLQEYSYHEHSSLISNVVCYF